MKAAEAKVILNFGLCYAFGEAQPIIVETIHELPLLLS
jgi:hypothetical protein